MAQNAATSGTAGAVRAELARGRRSGRELAKALDLPERTFRRRLAGQSPFTADEIAVVARFLGVPVATLLTQPEPAHSESVPA